MSGLKRIIRRLLVPRWSRDRPKIVIASSGRAGSTMLFEAVTAGFVRSRFGVAADTLRGRLLADLCADFVVRIAHVDQAPLAICKTHDTFAEPPQADCRFVFIYGDPLDSARSVARVTAGLGDEWFREHQQHLRATGAFSDLFSKDVLNFEGQLKSWLGQRRDDVLCIDYDDLWQEQSRLVEFLGFDVTLPERRRRQSVGDNTPHHTALFSGLRELMGCLKREYADEQRGDAR